MKHIFSAPSAPPATTPCCFRCGKKLGYGATRLTELGQRLVCDPCTLALATERIEQLYTPGDALHPVTVRRNAA